MFPDFSAQPPEGMPGPRREGRGHRGEHRERRRARGIDPMAGPMGGPFGRGRGRGPGRGPGRGGRGDVRNAVLALLNDSAEPMNGYQLIGAINERSDGLWQPGPGSIYPALGLLTEQGLISPVEHDGSRLFTLTDAGRAYVAEHADEVNAPWERVAQPHKPLLDVRDQLDQLHLALQQVALAGKPNQVEAARSILDQARRDLYRLLADDV